MKIIVKTYDKTTKEVKRTQTTILRKGMTTEQAEKIAKIEVAKMEDPACWEIK